MEKIVQPKTKVSILAKISLLCAILIPIILCLLGIILPSLILAVPLSLLLAIILGSIACYKVSKNKEHLRGKNWAISGIVVGSLLLILIISISAPKFWKASQKSRIGTVEADVDILAETLQRYHEDVGHYPSTSAGLKVIRTRDPIDDPDNKWNGPYLLFAQRKYVNNVPVDPWGNEYQYTSDGQSFTILSYGADGKPGGTGFNADITSEQIKRGEKLW